MKRILSVFLALAVILCSTSVVFASEGASVQEISSPEEFLEISSGSYKLTADIALTEGLPGTFSGTFDGNGHTIYIGSAANPAPQGVFATVNNATITNLTVKGAIKTAVNAGAFAGAATGTAIFNNCTNFADIDGTVWGSQYVGGILGNGFDDCTSVTFQNCVNYGKIATNGNTKTSSTGGLVGVSRSATITNCTNYGDIPAQCYAGGLIGWNTGALNVSNVANFGNITNDVSGREAYVGGAVGNLGAGATGSITNFFNAGQVYCGVIGIYAGSPTISGCVNVAATTYAMVGSGTVTTANCYYLEGTGSDTTKAEAKTSDELKGLTLEGYAKQSGYDYPLPSGIEYVTEEDANTVKISTAEQFKNIANGLTGSYKLTKDIDLSNCNYTAISGFAGVLDGNGFTINLGTGATQGVFATVNNATIKNLTVKGLINATVNAGAFAGAATGTATFINCTNFANVTAKSGAGYVGGILGNGYDSCTSVTFENCVNYGTSDVAGNTKNNSNGGMTGVGKNITIKNCVNYGEIIGQNRSGGLIGWNTNALNISNSANFGDVAISVSGRENNVGGAVGFLGGSATGSVTNFFNAGQVNCGVIGVYAGSLSISNCVNVSATAYAMVGSGTVTTSNCYFLEGTGSDSTGATVKTSDELKALKLEGFAIQAGYEYPLPEGIVYLSKEDASLITISTAAEFKNIANDLTASYKLTQDIDLSNCGYTAISGFAGVLDGNGKTINLGNSATQGVFATAKDFTIKNLTVKGSIDATVKAGAFVGDADGTAAFINCINYADVTGKAGGSYMGGILGDGYDNCSSVSFENCINYGTIDTYDNTNYIDIGGLAGVTKNATVENCINYGKVNGNRFSGGLIGWSTNKLELSDSANFGAVYSKSYGRARGGAVGNLGTASTGYIKNFSNAGQSTNGVAGSNSYSGTYSVALSISDCVNVGVTDNAMTNTVVNTSNCYYLEGKGTDSTGATAKTSDELKKLDITGFTVPTDIYEVEYPVPTTLKLTTNDVTITASEGGLVSPSGKIKVIYGRSVTFNVTPDDEYYAESCSYNDGDITLNNNNSYTTPAITAAASFDVQFAKIADIDVSDAVHMYEEFYKTSSEDSEYYYGENGSVIIFAKAGKAGPLTVTECGLLVDSTNSMTDDGLLYDGEGVRVLPFKFKNSLTKDGSYGILIYNNSYTQSKTFKVRAYAKYSNGKIAYSESKAIDFDAINEQ